MNSLLIILWKLTEKTNGKRSRKSKQQTQYLSILDIWIFIDSFYFGQLYIGVSSTFASIWVYIIVAWKIACEKKKSGLRAYESESETNERTNECANLKSMQIHSW